MNRIITFWAALVFSVGSLYAREAMTEDLSGWADGWRRAFSKEGIDEWKPEFTVRYYTGLTTTGPMLTGGVKVDGKRTFALFVGRGDTYLDYAPGDLCLISAGLNFRRYWHLGKRKISVFYSDLYAGAGWIYKIGGKYNGNAETGERWEVIDDNVGDVLFVGGWQPGIRVRCYKDLQSSSGQPLRQIVLDFIWESDFRTSYMMKRIACVFS